MKKFIFSLEKVMEFKNQNLENKKAEHAITIMHVRQQEQKIEMLRCKYSDINCEFNCKKTEGITINAATEYMSFLHTLENSIKRECVNLEGLKREEEGKRKEVVDMKIETSSLEKLKEKKLEQYQKDVQKSEELFIEEFVMRQRITG